MNILTKQKGFALLEVLIAALIMTIGGVAYMRLQQMGLQSSYNNYARTQGVVIVAGFIDTLRNNTEYFQTGDMEGYIISGRATSKKIGSIDFSKKICSVSNSTNSAGEVSKKISCNNETIFQLQNRFVQQQLQSSVPNSILCYRTNKEGFVRVTYLWKDNSAASKAVDLETLNRGDYCPADFNMVVNPALEQNMVSIYAQL